ncbi:hypothetical protein CPHO_01930 [Corynebacterium phocae]|uniref:DUF3039 domain-containing protein n=1 Tax=Corynebacterium phocae TaxID=161895 RepID=A0A1L7D198_9CORY|nr:hypothetical protein CPHO_01930 [Corynebacterium phocae]
MADAITISSPDRDSSSLPPTISSVSPRCFKLKKGRDRGAAFKDKQGQIWVVAAGFREEGSPDDFYSYFLSLDKKIGFEGWGPGIRDKELLETDHDMERLSSWRQNLWERIDNELGSLQAGDAIHLDIFDIFGGGAPLVGTIDIELVLLDDWPRPLGLEINARTEPRSSSPFLLRVATLVVLSRFHDDEQVWSAMYENDGASKQYVLEFDDDIPESNVWEGKTAAPYPGAFRAGSQTHHVLMTQSEADRKMVDGEPVTTLCGRTFVPRQDPQKLPNCDECQRIRKALS